MQWLVVSSLHIDMILNGPNTYSGYLDAESAHI